MDYFPSAAFRLRARNALKNNLSVAAMLVFLASLPGLLAQVAVAIAEQPLQETLYLLSVQFANTGVLPEATAIQSQIMKSITTPLLLSWGLQFLAWFITPFLTLGLLACLLTFLRGGQCTWQDVLCRRRCFFRAIGLTLLVALKVVLWMLPGLAFYGVALVGAFYWQSNFLLYVSTLGVVASSVLGIRAAMHYALADFVMADRPHLKVTTCIRESVSIMRLRKMQLFMLLLSFLGWSVLASLLSSLFNALSPVLGTTVSLIASLALNLYMYTAQCAFYDEYKDKPCIYTRPRKQKK